MAIPGELSASSHAGRRSRLKLVAAGGGTAGTGLARSRFRASRLAASATRLEPRSVGRILDAACELFAARFAPLFAVGFSLWVPAIFLARLIGRESFQGGAAQLVLSGCVDVLCAGFACVLVGASIEGREVSAADAFLTVLVRVPGLLMLSLVIGVSKVLVFACCIGIVPLWLLAVAPSVYVLERCNVFRAVGRGMSLVGSGSAFLRWGGYVLLGMLMTLPFSKLQQGLEVPALHERLRGALSLSETSLDFAIAAIGAPYLAVASAFLAVVQAVFYFDLRVRKEGYDLERRLDELEAAGASE